MIFYWIFTIIILLFCFVVFVGAPFVPTFSKDLKKIFDDIKLPKNSLIVDLGSGDGRLLVIAAKKGFRAIGYEINPILFIITKIRLLKYNNANVYLKNFWYADISKADLVFSFLATRYMPKLENKLLKELKAGSYFVSYAFELPNIKLIKKSKSAHYYKF